METIPEKACTRCKVSYPATTEYFTRCKGMKSGLKSECKVCSCARTIAHTRAQPDYAPRQLRKAEREAARALEQQKTTRVCRACQQEFPKNGDFFHTGNTSDGFSNICKPCAIARTAQWEQENPERANANRRRWAAVHRDEINAKHRAHRKANPEKYKANSVRYRKNSWHVRKSYLQLYVVKNRAAVAAGQRDWRARNRDASNEVARIWRSKNKHRISIYNRNTRAKRKSAEGKFTLAELNKRLETQKGRCHWCGEPLAMSGENKYHADHLIALHRGGSNYISNIVCACPTCNLKKKALLPWDFAGRLL